MPRIPDGQEGGRILPWKKATVKSLRSCSGIFATVDIDGKEKEIFIPHYLVILCDYSPSDPRYYPDRRTCCSRPFYIPSQIKYLFTCWD